MSPPQPPRAAAAAAGALVLTAATAVMAASLVALLAAPPRADAPGLDAPDGPSLALRAPLALVGSAVLGVLVWLGRTLYVNAAS